MESTWSLHGVRRRIVYDVTCDMSRHVVTRDMLQVTSRCEA